jgi:hypothetical protein
MNRALSSSKIHDPAGAFASIRAAHKPKRNFMKLLDGATGF